MKCVVKQVNVQMDSWDPTPSADDIPVHKLKRSKYRVAVIVDKGAPIGSFTMVLQHRSGVLQFTNVDGNVPLQDVGLSLARRLAMITHAQRLEGLPVVPRGVDDVSGLYVMYAPDPTRALALLHDLMDLGGWSIE